MRPLDRALVKGDGDVEFVPNGGCGDQRYCSGLKPVHDRRSCTPGRKRHFPGEISLLEFRPSGLTR